MLNYLLEHHPLYGLFKVHWFLLIVFFIYLYMKKIVVGELYRVTGNQRFYFFSAMFILLCLKVTPIDVIAAYYLFSAHVVQLSFVYFIVIPLIILSLPTNFLRRLVWNHRARITVSILSHPWLSLVTFNGLLTIYLIPAVFNFLHRIPLLAYLYQGILLISAIFMWVVIIQPIPEMKRINHLLRAVYIFIASVLLMPIGFYLVLVQKVHYPIYYKLEGVLFPVLTMIYDQQLAGGILKITQMFSYAFALLFIILQWGRREEEKEGLIEEENIRYVRGVVIHLNNDKR